MKHESRAQQDDGVMSPEQRELASLIDGLGIVGELRASRPARETPAIGPMFERLRRRRGVGRHWRWRRYLNRDRNAVVVREQDIAHR